MKRTTIFLCPVCTVPLVAVDGTKMSPSDGVTVWCDNTHCTAQEVAGHGSNEKNAFEIITQKYKI